MAQDFSPQRGTGGAFQRGAVRGGDDPGEFLQLALKLAGSPAGVAGEGADFPALCPRFDGPGNAQRGAGFEGGSGGMASAGVVDTDRGESAAASVCCGAMASSGTAGCGAGVAATAGSGRVVSADPASGAGRSGGSPRIRPVMYSSSMLRAEGSSAGAT